ncbi:MAG: hypothetical protein QM758_05230 [Armatimonas sp.]
MTPATPARLHVLFAREAPIGVIFRRGPSKQVRLILWHTDTNMFEPGQWLKGRIYEDKAALSPDGKLLAYFALDLRYQHGGGRRLFRQSELKEEDCAWIAISRPPYLTAIALWFNGWNTYGGLATFPDNHTVLLSGFDKIGKEPPEWLSVGQLPEKWDSWVASGRSRLETPEERQSALGEVLSGIRPNRYGLPVPYEKRLPNNGISLIKSSNIAEGNTFRLWNRTTDISTNLAVHFADVDPAGRLIVTDKGKLFVAQVAPDLSIVKTELADFNDMVFEPMVAPDWARV